MSFNVYTSAVIVQENKILLVREKKEVNYNRINFPGGHLELGETPMEGAIRETREETGLEISLKGLLAIYLGKSSRSFHYIFTGETIGGEHLQTEEVLSNDWYDISELITLPKEEFVYSEKLFDCLERLQKELIIPLGTIVDLKKI